MSEQSVYQKAREAFNKYAGIDVNAYEPECPHLSCAAGSKRCLDCGKASDVPLDRVSVLDKFPVWTRLQIRLAAWKGRNFGASGDDSMGVGEELGEAALGMLALLGIAVGSGACLHASLKTEQKIRGFDDPEKGRLAISDGVSDVIIFAIQLCTSFRLDFQTLITETAEEVLKRDWVKNQTNAHEVAQRGQVVLGKRDIGPGETVQAYDPTVTEQTAPFRRDDPYFGTPHSDVSSRRSGPDAYCFTTPDGDCSSTDPRDMHNHPDTAEILRRHDEVLEQHVADTGVMCDPHDVLIRDHPYTPHVKWPRDACDKKIGGNGDGLARLCGRSKAEHKVVLENNP